MPAISASAPAKCILFGEHAVVYQKPAIAIPLNDLRTSVYIYANPLGKPGIQLIDAPDIQLRKYSNELYPEHPIRVAIQSVVDFFQLSHFPACEIKISSRIPIAAGLGSSASTAVALIKALITFIGQSLDLQKINQLAFQVEKAIHGNPSGIDNTVITFEKPVFYIRDSTIDFLNIQKPMDLVIGDSGIKSLTKEVVSQVKEKWLLQPKKYEEIFDEIGKISIKAKEALTKGDLFTIGELMSENHALLQDMGVSCKILDELVRATGENGALGAKLCGSGLGGNMIALLKKTSDREKIQQALISSGAVATYYSQLKSG